MAIEIKMKELTKQPEAGGEEEDPGMLSKGKEENNLK